MFKTLLIPYQDNSDILNCLSNDLMQLHKLCMLVVLFGQSNKFGRKQFCGLHRKKYSVFLWIKWHHQRWMLNNHQHENKANNLGPFELLTDFLIWDITTCMHVK